MVPMKWDAFASKALAWLAGLVTLLVLSQFSPEMLRGDRSAQIVAAPLAGASGIEAATLFVALLLFVTGILLYAYSATIDKLN